MPRHGSPPRTWTRNACGRGLPTSQTWTAWRTVSPLRAMVAWPMACNTTWGLCRRPRSGAPPLGGRVGAAHRVLADRDNPDKGDQGRSVVDPEARCGTPGAYFDGYLLDIRLDADSERLTALHLLPGNGDEARDTPTLLAAEARAQGKAVAAVSIDGMG